MSAYDMLPRGSQVKCWSCDMKTYRVGDEVPELYPEYVVLLVEGGYVRVKAGIITRIIENRGRKAYYPEDFPKEVCIDKWGTEVKERADLEHSNIFGCNYYWWKEELNVSKTE